MLIPRADSAAYEVENPGFAVHARRLADRRVGVVMVAGC